MAHQLDFESHLQALEESNRTRLSAKRIGAGSRRLAIGALPLILRWAPVWLPGMLLVQIALFGILPVLAERSRLDRVELELSEREDTLLSASATVERHRRMLADELYRERVRKSIARAEEPPLLHLEASRPAATSRRD